MNELQKEFSSETNINFTTYVEHKDGTYKETYSDEYVEWLENKLRNNE